MNRITQKRAAEWVRNPRGIFKGARVNFHEKTGTDAERFEVTVHDDNGPSIIVEFSRGPAGISVYVRAGAGGVPLSVSGNVAGNQDPLPKDIEAYEVSATAYYSDEWAQAFKAWYKGKGPYPGEKPGSS